MSKIKVLVVPSDRTGVSKFRSVEPHMRLQELYGDEFFVDIITAGDNIDWDNEKYIKSFDIVHFHRTLPLNGQQVYMEPMWNLLEKIKGYGVITVMDLDDYWIAGPEHPMYKLLKQQQLDVKIKNNVKRVDYVTTTTPIYAEEIRKLNKNVVVLPNSINPEEPQFTPNNEKSDRLRVGWLGGSSHEQDLAVAYGGVGQFIDDHKEDTQFVLCGFDTRGNITEINQQTGEQTQRKIKPQESVWYRYESSFTKNYSYITPDLKTSLMKFDRESDEHTDFSNQAYRRVWTKPITTYASNYNLFDISLAPLKETMFNKVKSQLKVIEAGFHKKALIAQDFGPYQIDLINAVEKGGKINENGNAILIPSKKNHKQWQKEIKRLYDNRELIDLLGNNLYNTVVDKYHIDVVTKTRAEMYKRIVSDNQNEIKEIIEETNAV
jgi:glycosyltransferase involved in cell wall biosynthesis